MILDRPFVEPHPCSQIPLAVAINDQLPNERIVPEAKLDVRRRHVFSTSGHQDLFFAIDDLEKTVLREAADVAGLEPTILGERLLRCGRIFVIAREHVRTTCEDLSVGSELQLDRSKRFSNRVEAKRVR